MRGRIRVIKGGGAVSLQRLIQISIQRCLDITFSEYRTTLTAFYGNFSIYSPAVVLLNVDLLAHCTS